MVQFDDPLGDRQAEPRSALLARRGRVGLRKLLEDLHLMVCRNSGPSITNGDRKRAIRYRSLDRHRAPVRELDGIADKVKQHLREATLIAAADGQIRGDFNIERQILFGRERFDRDDHGVYELSK